MAAKRYIALLGIVLFLFIVLNLNLQEIAAVLLAADPVLFFAVCVISLISGALKGIRWNLITKAHGIAMPVLQSVKYFFIGFFISVLTPARVGELLKAVYIKRYAKSTSAALPTVIIDRLIDIAFLLTLGFIAVASFAYAFGTVIVPFWALTAVLLLFVAGIACMLKQNAVGFVLKPFFNALVPERYRSRAQTGFNDFYKSLNRAKQNKRLIGSSVLLTLCAWSVSILAIYMLMLSIGITSVPFYYVIVMLPIISLLDLLPVSVSGIGTRDAALIFLLGFYGIAAEVAVALSILMLLAGYVITSAIGAVLFSREPVSTETLFGKRLAAENSGG